MVFNATFNNISINKYHGGRFYWWRKPECPEKTTSKVFLHDSQAAGNYA
jgi:hypothetical protein